jgi:hypothetical protein
VFRVEPDNPRFYGLDDLMRQNEMWQSSSIEDAFGEISPGLSLGILPQMSIVIGGLGLDTPIVLDYRESISDPPVLYLMFNGSPRWIKVASSVDELIEILYGDEG